MKRFVVKIWYKEGVLGKKGTWALDQTRIPLKRVLWMLKEGKYTLKDIHKGYGDDLKDRIYKLTKNKK